MTDSNENAVRLEDVRKTFGDHVAVDALSLIVPKGCVYGFIGPNGSGKTTTIRMILHIFLPDSGTVEVLGSRQTRAANDRIGYLPEERGLYKRMKVQQVLAYYAGLKGLRGARAREAIGTWLERMGLEAWASKKVEALSKGMAQKIQFISSVIAAPDLLILDEPFSGLDPVNLEVLRDAIIDLKHQGTTIIFSTHDMTMAEKMCDYLFMIFKGRKVLDGNLESIQSRYGNDTIRLRMENGRQTLKEIQGIEQIRDLGNSQEIRYQGDPQELLRQLSANHRIQLFEVAKPSLHDIFVRIAGPEAATAEAKTTKPITTD